MLKDDGFVQLDEEVPIIEPSPKVYVISHPFFRDHQPYRQQVEQLIAEATEPFLNN
ncbi:MAG: hypothetical protein QF632_05985 [Candidatus Woesearchaeota archaeon]|jgi:hypothetical protein|nr:hypothetical protein [Candidatus Woesearchaeota archaeon]MDP7457500.1 hypothetical protein [Candidatus Woesearchaeota archaeon]|tara:strand:+ start:362 stop:529 length:168 start_codon:yes stop_codon:yes gene_type:complete